jgi:hypothetical protein
MLIIGDGKKLWPFCLARGGKRWVICPKQPEGGHIASWLILGSCAYQEVRLGS